MSEQELKPCGDLFKAQYEYDQVMNEKFQVIWSKHSDNSKASLTKEQIALQYFKNGYEIRRIEGTRSTSPEVEKLVEAVSEWHKAKNEILEALTLEDVVSAEREIANRESNLSTALASYRKSTQSEKVSE